MSWLALLLLAVNIWSTAAMGASTHALDKNGAADRVAAPEHCFRGLELGKSYHYDFATDLSFSKVRAVRRTTHAALTRFCRNNWTART